MLRIAVLASHQGTNFQAIVDACKSELINATVVTLICNNSNAPVMQRAHQEKIPSHHLSSRTHSNPDELDRAICEVLDRSNTELVVLAGYMKKLGPRTLDTFSGRIINVHPSLLPLHGGTGAYGIHVHESVIASGDQQSGVSVHHVTAIFDEGEVIRQVSIPVLNDDTPQSLAKRIQKLEHTILIDVIDELSIKPSFKPSLESSPCNPKAR